MFSDINEIPELYKRRQELIRSGEHAKAVNSAFNARKKYLTESAHSFSEVPYDTVEVRTKGKYGVFVILGSGDSNELSITEKGMYV